MDLPLPQVLSWLWLLVEEQTWKLLNFAARCDLWSSQERTMVEGRAIPGWRAALQQAESRAGRWCQRRPISDQGMDTLKPQSSE